MATLDDASMADASMSASGLSPAAPVVPPVANSGFYGIAATVFASVLSFVSTTTIRVIRESIVRADPAAPPTLVANVVDECIGYVTGPRPRRNALGEFSDATAYRVWIDPATIDEPPQIADLIDVSGERYVVNEIQRIPAAGPTIVAWKLSCGRSQ